MQSVLTSVGQEVAFLAACGVLLSCLRGSAVTVRLAKLYFGRVLNICRLLSIDNPCFQRFNVGGCNILKISAKRIELEIIF